MYNGEVILIEIDSFMETTESQISARPTAPRIAFGETLPPRPSSVRRYASGVGPNRNTLILGKWDDHTTARGHRLLADKLHEGLVPLLFSSPHQ